MKKDNDINVVLINPRSTHLGEIAQKCFPPMGLLCLATALHRKDVQVTLIDANALGLADDELISRIRKIDPLIVGLSVYAETMHSALRTIDCIKADLPEIKIVLGGPQASACPQWVLKELPRADYLIEGEAEESLWELVRALAFGDDVTSIAGVHGPAIEHNSARRSINLDDFPIADRSFLREAYGSGCYYALLVPHRKLDCLVTSRGCPCRCNFCYNRSNKVRFRSIDSCLDEISRMHDSGVKNIEILDDNFTAVESRAMEFFERIRKARFGITFRIKSRADSISERLVNSAAQASVYQISIGAESGSPRLLEAMNKRLQPVQIADAVRMVKGKGIKCHASFIVGYPGETMESIDATTELICKIRPTTVGLSILIPYPGTVVYEQACATATLVGQWSAQSPSIPWVRLPWTRTYEDLAVAKRKMLRRIYLSSHYVLSYGHEVVRHANLLLARYAIQELKKIGAGSLVRK